jgi:PAS domain S-box-containing protein
MQKTDSGEAMTTESPQHGSALESAADRTATREDPFEANPAENPLPQRVFWLATALRSAADGILILSSAGTLQYLNPVAEQLTGFRLKEVHGRHYSEALFFEHHGSRLTDDLVRLATLSDEPISLGRDLTLTSRDGIRRNVEGELASSGHDAPLHMIVVTLRDVTHRKWEERQREQRETIRAIERLAETAAHKFNNLLTTILGNSELLLNDATISGQHRANTLQIHGAAVEAASLAGQLATLSRKQIAFPQELCVNSLLDTFLPTLRNLLPATIEIHTATNPGVRKVSADRAELEQALFHLVRNAVDALPTGGQIFLSTENVVLDANERIRRKEHFVSIKVRDTGAGMDEETVNRIFEPFFTSRNDGRHAGLGLSIVQGIVRDNSGYINVRSKPAEGTEIELCLPAVEDDPFPYLNTEQPEAGQTAAKSVLIVEDDHAVRLLMRKILEEREYQVLEAQDGEEALLIAQLQESRIDLLITDVMMPGMNGPELVGQFAPVHPETKILMVSGYAADKLSAASSLPKGVEFLPKPFTRLDLLNTVEHLIGEDNASRGETRS